MGCANDCAQTGMNEEREGEGAAGGRRREQFKQGLADRLPDLGLYPMGTGIFLDDFKRKQLGLKRALRSW